jgi:hypothetical protein
MASGQSFAVRHPEMITMAKSSIRVFTSTAPDAENGERWHDVSLMLMETLEPIGPAGA